MEDYKSNSDKARQEQQSEKKVEAVITGAAKTRKKGEMQKFADVFIAEDANNVKSYILMEVIVPAVKKAISDIVTTGIDMILYGEAGRSKKTEPRLRCLTETIMNGTRTECVQVPSATDAIHLIMMIFSSIPVEMRKRFSMQ